jgi:integrase
MKKPNGVYAYQYLDADGKRKTESLKTKRLAEAKTKAAELAKVATAKDAAEAVERIAEAKRLVTKDTVHLSEVWDRFLATGPTCSEGTLGNYERDWTRFFTWMKENRPNVNALGEVDRETVLVFLDELWKSGLSASRWNDIRNGCGKVHRTVASRCKGIQADTWPYGKGADRKGVQMERKPLDATQRERLFEVLEESTLPHKGEWRLLFALGMFAGMRLADAVLIKTDSVRGGWITYTPRKTRNTSRAEAKVPVLPPLAKVLEEVDTGTDYLLPNLSEMYLRSESSIKHHTQRIIMEAVGDVKQEITEGQRKQVRSPYGFHSLRHSFAACAVLAGAKSGQLKSMLGDNLQTIDRYYSKAKVLDGKVLDAGYMALGYESAVEDERQRLKQLADELPLDEVRRLLDMAGATA